MFKSTTFDGASGRGAERAVGERSGKAAGRVAETIPDPELVAQPRRRRFTAEYKLRIVQQADACTNEGPMPEGLNTRDKMEWKLKTEDGRRKMIQRWSSVEPVCGQIKQAMGFRQFSLRGHRKASGEWTLVCTAHNILKLLRAGAKLPGLPSAVPQLATL